MAEEAKQEKKNFIFAVGRRRESIARVRLYKKNDVRGIVVNGIPVDQYFFGEAAKKTYMQPFTVIGGIDEFGVTVKVKGGGKSGQLQAMVHGIARALSSFNRDTFRTPLKREGLLVRDPRTRQRRKVGMGGKSRRKKQSPKR